MVCSSLLFVLTHRKSTFLKTMPHIQWSKAPEEFRFVKGLQKVRFKHRQFHDKQENSSCRLYCGFALSASMNIEFVLSLIKLIHGVNIQHHESKHVFPSIIAVVKCVCREFCLQSGGRNVTGGCLKPGQRESSMYLHGQPSLNTKCLFFSFFCYLGELIP